MTVASVVVAEARRQGGGPSRSTVLPDLTYSLREKLVSFLSKLDFVIKKWLRGKMAKDLLQPALMSDGSDVHIRREKCEIRLPNGVKATTLPLTSSCLIYFKNVEIW